MLWRVISGGGRCALSTAAKSCGIHVSRAPCTLMRELSAESEKVMQHSPFRMLIVCFPSLDDLPGTQTLQAPRQLLRSPAELLIRAVSEPEYRAIHVLEEVRREVGAEQQRPQAFHGPRLLPGSCRRDNEHDERLMHELFLQTLMSVLSRERSEGGRTTGYSSTLQRRTENSRRRASRAICSATSRAVPVSVAYKMSRSRS